MGYITPYKTLKSERKMLNLLVAALPRGKDSKIFGLGALGCARADLSHFDQSCICFQPNPWLKSAVNLALLRDEIKKNIRCLAHTGKNQNTKNQEEKGEKDSIGA